jgi:hypothetical protein
MFWAWEGMFGNWSEWGRGSQIARSLYTLHLSFTEGFDEVSLKPIAHVSQVVWQGSPGMWECCWNVEQHHIVVAHQMIRTGIQLAMTGPCSSPEFSFLQIIAPFYLCDGGGI